LDSAGQCISSFETAWFLRIQKKIENMSTICELKSERPIAPPHDPAEADSRRRAECAEKISRLLSALDGGPSLQAGKAGNLPKAVIRETKTNPDSETLRQSLLVDGTASTGVFGSREYARQHRHDLQHYGASIISVEKKSMESRAVREQPTNQPDGITGGFSSPKRSTTQELEKANDLGGSHPNSLRQGGALTANSTVMRVLGKIFPAAAKTDTFNADPQSLSNRCELVVLGNTGAQITNLVGFGNRTLTYAPPDADYETVNIHYTAEPANDSQCVRVKVNYTTPTSLKPTPPSVPSQKWLNGGTGLSYIVQTQTS
jgi:hypothetical protein